MARLYPLYADLSDRRVLVIGAGSVAERKISQLLDTGAVISVWSETATPVIEQWHAQGLLTLNHVYIPHKPFLLKRWRLSRAIKNSFLVIAATNDKDINHYVAATAEKLSTMVNVVDDMAATQFHVPAVITRGPMQAAISSAGVAPVLARQLRAKLEREMDESFAELAQLLARYRERIKQYVPDVKKRRLWYENLLSSEVPGLLKSQKIEAATTLLEQSLQNASADTVTSEEKRPTGKVILVGAGPGDPGLLTIQAMRELQLADVIVHDRLVSDAVLNLARRDAERILVAKRSGDHQSTQEQINTILVREANKDQRVVRLKGGDSFIFGRGGEELEHLLAHDIQFSIVPGVTAASACSTYAGIPLTHREHAQSVRLVTAHCQQNMDCLDWPALAEDSQTLAVYMGVSQLAFLQAQLLKHGRRADTPFAIIENGTRPEQRVISGQLTDLHAAAVEHQIKAPSMVILGDVASLANKLHWFGATPLEYASDSPLLETLSVAA